MNEYFPKPKSLRANVKVKLDLSNYATKVDLKNAAGVHTSNFAKKIVLANLKSGVDNLDIDELKNLPNNLINLKSKIDKLDVDKLVPALADLSKLSDLIKNDVVKKVVYDTKIKNIQDEISDITNLTINTTLNSTINEIKNKIPSITNLGTAAAIYTLKNKILNVSDLFKKADYDAKVSEMAKNILLLLITISS